MAASSASSAGSAGSTSRPFRGQRHRGWCFTVNNPDDDFTTYLETMYSGTNKYVIYGREVAPSTGTPHLQGFIYCKNLQSDIAIHEVFGSHHYEPIKGTPAQNIAYCAKTGDYTEINESHKPVGQGKRTDLRGLLDEAQKGTSTLSLIADGGLTSGAALRTWRALQATVRAPRRDEVRVAWFYGPSGVGKTRAAFEILGSEAYCLSSAPWWPGYDGQQDVIVDDYDPTTLSAATVLRILDRYPWFCPVKGGNIPFRGIRIIFTSCEHPQCLLGTRWPECLRRLSSVSSTGRATMDGKFLYEFRTPPTGYPYQSSREIDAFSPQDSSPIPTPTSSPTSPHEASVDVPSTFPSVPLQEAPLRF